MANYFYKNASSNATNGGWKYFRTKVMPVLLENHFNYFLFSSYLILAIQLILHEIRIFLQSSVYSLFGNIEIFYVAVDLVYCCVFTLLDTFYTCSCMFWMFVMILYVVLGTSRTCGSVRTTRRTCKSSY